MIPNTPEYLHDEVLSHYGLDIPLSDIYALLESDNYLTPESLYLYYADKQPNLNIAEKVVKIPKGFTAVDLKETETFIIPRQSGNYIWLLKNNCNLPLPDGVANPTFNRIKLEEKTYRVMYTGKAKDLYNRLYTNHLNGKIARSTLRKSLATLFGFKFTIYLSGKSKKVRITDLEENIISTWLRENCILMFKTYTKIDEVEEKLIYTLDPPLNIDDNAMTNNILFVQQLSSMRSSMLNHTSRNSSGNSASNMLSVDNIIMYIIVIILLSIIVLSLSN